MWARSWKLPVPATTTKIFAQAKQNPDKLPQMRKFMDYYLPDFAAFNEVYAKYFTSKPARSCVAVKDLPKGVLCEIEAVAEA